MAIAPVTQKQAVIELGGVCVVPPWVDKLIGSCDSITESVKHGCASQVTYGKEFTLVTVRVSGASHDDALKMQRRTSLAYETIAHEIATSLTHHPIRFWNFIPDIQCEMGGGLSRYMSFNAGRFSAYFDWYADGKEFANSIATATAVGYHGNDLVIHALASARPGVHIHNPRQCPPHEYSTSFGPMPPCFARATVLPSTNSSSSLILIGGTASVNGETSTHLDDVRAQTDETFENMKHLMDSVPSVNHVTGGQQKDFDPVSLRWMDTLRVYYLHQKDQEVIEQMVRRHVPHIEDIEFLRADICRPELLVEIEGTARPTST